MRKLLVILLFLIAGSLFAQVSQDSVYISGTTSNAFKLEQKQYIIELYFPSGFSGTEVTIQAGDVADTTNFAALQDIYGTTLKITGISAPARVFFSISADGLFGQRTLRFVSNASESGVWIKYKTVYIN